VTGGGDLCDEFLGEGGMIVVYDDKRNVFDGIVCCEGQQDQLDQGCNQQGSEELPVA